MPDNEPSTTVAELIDQARADERTKIASVMRILEKWGQLDVKGFPLVNALVEKLERDEAI